MTVFYHGRSRARRKSGVSLTVILNALSGVSC